MDSNNQVHIVQSTRDCQDLEGEKIEEGRKGGGGKEEGKKRGGKKKEEGKAMVKKMKQNEAKRSKPMPSFSLTLDSTKGSTWTLFFCRTC
jgi:hypothetical protein